MHYFALVLVLVFLEFVFCCKRNSRHYRIYSNIIKRRPNFRTAPLWPIRPLIETGGALKLTKAKFGFWIINAALCYLSDGRKRKFAKQMLNKVKKLLPNVHLKNVFSNQRRHHISAAPKSQKNSSNPAALIEVNTCV